MIDFQSIEDLLKSLFDAAMNNVLERITASETVKLFDRVKEVLISYLEREGKDIEDCEIDKLILLLSYYNCLCLMVQMPENQIHAYRSLVKEKQGSKQEFDKVALNQKKEDLETLFISNIPIDDSKDTDSFFVCMDSPRYKAHIIEREDIADDMLIREIPYRYKAQALNNFDLFYENINYIPCKTNKKT